MMVQMLLPTFSTLGPELGMVVVTGGLATVKGLAGGLAVVWAGATVVEATLAGRVILAGAAV